MARLPRDHVGRPVPWFVAFIDGTPDFRVIAPGKLSDAHRFRLCWVCGGPLGAHGAFVIGPMCGVNRVSAEPPSHRACAIYSATHCPFLTTPRMVRRKGHIPQGASVPAGVMIERNPGVSLVWVTRRWKRFYASAGAAGHLWDIGEDPVVMLWYAHGRTAERAEIERSITTGLPLLEAEVATAADRAEFDRRLHWLMERLPE